MNIKLQKSTALVFFIFTLSGKLPILLCGYVAVLIHEAMHLAVCILLKERPEKLSLNIWGMNLVIKNTADTKKAFIIWASGPIFSLFVFAVFFLLGKYNYFMYANLCIGIINLVPALPLDGGMLLNILLSCSLGIIKAEKIMRTLSSFVCLASFSLCVLCIIWGTPVISFFIFTIMLALSQKHWQNQALVSRKNVFSGQVQSKKRFRLVSLGSQSTLLEAAEMISPSYTLIIAVFEEGKFLGVITQDDFLKVLKNYGLHSSIGKCIL